VNRGYLIHTQRIMSPSVGVWSNYKVMKPDGGGCTSQRLEKRKGVGGVQWW